MFTMSINTNGVRGFVVKYSILKVLSRRWGYSIFVRGMGEGTEIMLSGFEGFVDTLAETNKLLMEAMWMDPCPFCGSSDLEDCYVYIKCNSCLAEGPATNQKRNDDHADFRDREIAIKKWNKRV